MVAKKRSRIESATLKLLTQVAFFVVGMRLGYGKLVVGQTERFAMPIVIAASEAKAKFSELLERVQSGESFSITLHGEEAARLVPSRRPSLENIQSVIAQMKVSRSVLNPSGQKQLKVKDLVNEGRS